jgi:hypothetical protein
MKHFPHFRIQTGLQASVVGQAQYGGKWFDFFSNKMLETTKYVHPFVSLV